MGLADIKKTTSDSMIKENNYFLIALSLLMLLSALCTGTFYFFCIYEKEAVHAAGLPGSSVPYGVFHLGYGTEEPRSSLVGTMRALQDDATFIDLDVQLSQDDVLVVFHDIDLSQNTDSKGSVSSYNLRGLEKIKIKHTTSQVAEERIHSLSDHLDAIETTGGFLIIEIKDREKERAIRALSILKNDLEKRGLQKKALIVSSNPLFICRINDADLYSMYTFVGKKYLDAYEEMYGSNPDPGSFYTLPWYAKSLYAQRAIRKVCPPTTIAIQYTVDERIISKIKEANYPYFIYAPNTEGDIEYALSLEPYAVVSDRPSLLKKVLNK